LWLWVAPLLPFAGSLSGLLELRMAQGALVAVGAAWAAGRSVRRSPWAAALGAGLLAAVDPGLLDTLLVSFRGYGAPELVSLGVAALVSGARGWRLGPSISLLCGLAAAGQHPLAAGALAGWVLASPMLVRRLGWRPILGAVTVGALSLIPRVLHLWSQSQCGQGAWGCLSSIAHGSTEGELGALAMLQRAFHDRLLVDMGAVWPIAVCLLVFGAGLVLRLGLPRVRAPGAVALGLYCAGALVGLCCLGLSVGSLRPYHLRILAGPLWALAAVGAGRWPLWGLACCLLTGAYLLGQTPLAPDPNGPARMDELARAVSRLPDAQIRVEGAFFHSPVGVEAAPVVLSAVLQGQPNERFSVAETARLVLICSGEGPGVAAPHVLAVGSGWRALTFENADAGRTWLQAHPERPLLVGGSADWLRAVDPGQVVPPEAELYPR
jgi:hypothetical protein